MRVGVYVDGYNLYYGGRRHCGRGTAGWRWLDLRALASHIVAGRPDWPRAVCNRLVYCTARIDGRTNPDGQRDQDIYLKAVTAHGAVDHIEYGRYVARAKKAMLAVTDAKGRPVIATSQWPVMVKDFSGGDVPQAQFMAQVLHIEEKGSDVNVATHLLMDVFDGSVDAAVVVSNDSDLQLPLHQARRRVPVGLVNPGDRQLAGALRGTASEGVGRHWWTQLQATDFLACQMPATVGRYSKPVGW